MDEAAKTTLTAEDRRAGAPASTVSLLGFGG
jgi:hypothetical protein